MAFRSRLGRQWCLVTGCALVCAVAVSAQGGSAGLPRLPAGAPAAETAELPRIALLPAAPLVRDVLIPSSAFETVRRTQTRVYTGDGFDACHAPSRQAMAAWRKTSPYRAVGVYIGGVNRVCGDGNLSRDWVHAVTATGWQLIPIYVGRQAPCTRQRHLRLMSGKTALVEASAAADDAASRAASFGVARGSAIYFDLESYGRKNDACTNTVLRYIGAWTSRLHAHGYLAGVYSSADSGITDLARAASSDVPKPDALWIARWDNGRTVQDPSVPSGAWTPHLRLKQFTGDHAETHGGVTLDIDCDWLDGPVARIV